MRISASELDWLRKHIAWRTGWDRFDLELEAFGEEGAVAAAWHLPAAFPNFGATFVLGRDRHGCFTARPNGW